MSSVTFAIVACALRTSGPSPAVSRSPAAARSHLEAEAPQTAEKPGGALDSFVLPVHVLLGRSHEEDVEADGVGAVAVDVVVRGDHVPLRLRHFRAQVADHPLVEQARERLPEAEIAKLVQHLRKEAGVEQVQDRVLDPADVLVHRQPVVDEVPAERRLVVLRIRVAQVVPGRVDERVHRVGLALRRAAALRARGRDPVLGRGER